MKARGVSFRHAMELLRADHPCLAAPLDRVVRKATAETVRLDDVVQPTIDAADDADPGNRL
jgi:hypothetical protein